MSSNNIELSCRELLRECLRMDSAKRDIYARHEKVFEDFFQQIENTKEDVEYMVYTLEDVLLHATTCFREVMKSLTKHITPEFLELCKKYELSTLLKQRMKRVITHWFRVNKSQIFTRTNYKDYLRIMKLIFG